MIEPALKARPEPITVVVNWPSMLGQTGGK
jgi:hypothetical protein